jgi:dCMP deaminase
VKELVRPDFDSWALGIAEAVSLRGDCTRRRVGAVLLDQDHRLIGAGYNGTQPGGPSCLAGDCPRGRHYRQEEPSGRTCRMHGEEHVVGEVNVCVECVFSFKCACGKEWLADGGCEDSVEPGSSYDTGPGVCHASHAEQNALADVEARYRLDGATMYVTIEPCGGCVRQIVNTTKIARIVWPDDVIEIRRTSPVSLARYSRSA